MKEKSENPYIFQTLSCYTVIRPPARHWNQKQKGKYVVAVALCCCCCLSFFPLFSHVFLDVSMSVFGWRGRRNAKPRSEMAGWSGFTDEELHRLKRETSQEESKKETPAAKIVSGRGDRRGRPTNARVKARPIIADKVWEERAGNGLCGLRRSTG